MKYIQNLILVLILIILTACNEKDDKLIINEEDYLIFGHFYGMCVGDGCVATYKLTNKNLYKDTTHQYNASSFNFKELNTTTFNNVQNLTSQFPNQLLNVTDTHIGCPDCADQGGLYIEYKSGSEIKKWKIDQNKNEVPEYLHTFIDAVNAKIQLINQ